MKYKILFYFLIISSWNYAQNIQLKDGDLIFQSMNCGELCEAINQVTEGYNGIDFNHIGMIVTQSDSILVLEASGSKVKLTPLKTFKSYTNQTMYVGRLKKRFQKLIPNAIEFGLQQLDKPYDDAYLYDNESYYCSELIYDCFLQANGKPFFKLYPMTFKAPGSNDYFKAWADYYQKLNVTIPEGKLGCNPGGISTSKRIKILGVL
jgi:hypothetical protein